MLQKLMVEIDEALCGTIGEVSTFSFMPTHITTGEVEQFSPIQRNITKFKKMINLDFSEPQRFNHDNFYWNYRMSGLQAALEYLKQTAKNYNFKRIRKLLHLY